MSRSPFFFLTQAAILCSLSCAEPGVITDPQGVPQLLGQLVASGSALDGAPVPQATCTLEGTQLSTTSDNAGFFVFEEPTAGSYLLLCRHQIDGLHLMALVSIEVRAGESRDLGVIPLTLAGAISGTVTMLGATDHAGTRVSVAGTSLGATTDSPGDFLIDPAPTGTHTLTVEREGFLPMSIAGVVVLSQRTTATSRVDLASIRGVTGTISINNGALFSNNVLVDVTISASSQATKMRLSEDANFADAGWQDVSATQTWTFSGQGKKTLYAQFGAAENESLASTASIIIDTVPPTKPEVIINDGAATTNDGKLSLTVSSNDATTDVVEMSIATDTDFNGATWVPYATAAFIEVTATTGTHIVYVKTRDRANNESLSGSGSIFLQTQVPGSTMAVASADAAAPSGYTGQASVEVTFDSATTAGVISVFISEDATFAGVDAVPFSDSLPVLLSTGDGEKTVYAKLVDDAGGESAALSASIILDTTAPTAPVIADTPTLINTARITLALASVSSDANFDTYEIKGGKVREWKAAGVSDLTFDLYSTQTLEVRARDIVGNISEIDSVVLRSDTRPPSVSLTLAVIDAEKSLIASGFQVSEVADCTFEYGTSESYGTKQNFPATLAGVKVPVSWAFEAQTTFYYRLRCTDEALNDAVRTNSVDSGTIVSGTTSGNLTWTKAMSPVSLAGDYTVSVGNSLTIDAGVQVRALKDADRAIVVNGTLDAQGASGASIRFDDVAIKVGTATNINTVAVINLKRIYAVRSPIHPDVGSRVFSTLTLTDSRLASGGTVFLNEPVGNSKIERNDFGGGSVFAQVGSDGQHTVSIVNNLFLWGTTSTIRVGQRAPGLVTITFNSFLSAERVAIEMLPGLGHVDVAAKDNYWFTYSGGCYYPGFDPALLDDSLIPDLIQDFNDIDTLKTISFDPPLDIPDGKTPSFPGCA